MKREEQDIKLKEAARLRQEAEYHETMARVASSTKKVQADVLLAEDIMIPPRDRSGIGKWEESVPAIVHAGMRSEYVSQQINDGGG